MSPQTVQENFIAYFRHFAGLPDIHFVEDENATWITTGHGAPGSQVMKTNFTPDSAFEQINEILRQAGEHVNEIDWFVWPGDKPDEIGRALQSVGEAGGPAGEWMLYGNIGKQPGTWLVIDLEKLTTRIPIASGFHVQQVQNTEQLEAWVEINARGFGSTEYSAFHSAYLRHGFGPDAEALHFIGYLEDKPVTSSTLIIAGGSASAFNISTPSEVRGRGFGSAITRATLQAARDRGYSSSWIWSSPMGKSVYQKLGFVVTDFGVREYQWKKRT